MRRPAPTVEIDGRHFKTDAAVVPAVAIDGRHFKTGAAMVPDVAIDGRHFKTDAAMVPAAVGFACFYESAPRFLFGLGPRGGNPRISGACSVYYIQNGDSRWNLLDFLSLLRLTGAIPVK